MKTIGLLGGMSWESTVTYYQLINEQVNKTLGGLHSAKILLYSVDFAEIEECLATGNDQRAADILTQGIQALEKGGASFVVIASNTMHKVLPLIQKNISIPILHIAKSTVLELQSKGIKSVGLIGTRYTMTQDFYKSILNEAGIEVIVPSKEEIEIVDNIIFKELCVGKIKESSRGIYQRVIDGLDMRGAKGIIFGCTEIGLLISQKYVRLPVFDTTVIHAHRAAEIALK